MSEKSPYNKHPFKRETKSGGRLDEERNHRGKIQQSDFTGLCKWICSCGGVDTIERYRFESLESLEKHYSRVASKKKPADNRGQTWRNGYSDRKSQF